MFNLIQFLFIIIHGFFFFFLSKIVIEISKYRVLLDTKTEEMNNNNALLTKTQEEFHNAVTKLAQIELVGY